MDGWMILVRCSLRIRDILAGADGLDSLVVLHEPDGLHYSMEEELNDWNDWIVENRCDRISTLVVISSVPGLLMYSGINEGAFCSHSMARYIQCRVQSPPKSAHVIQLTF